VHCIVCLCVFRGMGGGWGRRKGAPRASALVRAAAPIMLPRTRQGYAAQRKLPPGREAAVQRAHPIGGVPAGRVGGLGGLGGWGVEAWPLKCRGPAARRAPQTGRAREQPPLQPPRPPLQPAPPTPAARAAHQSFLSWLPPMLRSAWCAAPAPYAPAPLHRSLRASIMSWISLQPGAAAGARRWGRATEGGGGGRGRGCDGGRACAMPGLPSELPSMPGSLRRVGARGQAASPPAPRVSTRFAAPLQAATQVRAHRSSRHTAKRPLDIVAACRAAVRRVTAIGPA
jgi:hypothetical protein